MYALRGTQLGREGNSGTDTTLMAWVDAHINPGADTHAHTHKTHAPTRIHAVCMCSTKHVPLHMRRRWRMNLEAQQEGPSRSRRCRATFLTAAPLSASASCLTPMTSVTCCAAAAEKSKNWQ